MGRSRFGPEPPKTISGQHLGLRADVSRSLTSCSPAAYTQMDQALLKCHKYPCLPGEKQISLIMCHGQEPTHTKMQRRPVTNRTHRSKTMNQLYPIPLNKKEPDTPQIKNILLQQFSITEILHNIHSVSHYGMQPPAVSGLRETPREYYSKSCAHVR